MYIIYIYVYYYVIRPPCRRSERSSLCVCFRVPLIRGILPARGFQNTAVVLCSIVPPPVRGGGGAFGAACAPCHHRGRARVGGWPGGKTTGLGAIRVGIDKGSSSSPPRAVRAGCVRLAPGKLRGEKCFQYHLQILYVRRKSVPALPSSPFVSYPFSGHPFAEIASFAGRARRVVFMLCSVSRERWP